MWTLRGGKMVWVPMAPAGEEGADAGMGAGAGGEDSGAEGPAGAEAPGLPPGRETGAEVPGAEGREVLKEGRGWGMTEEARKVWDYDPFAPKEEGTEGAGGQGHVESGDAGGEDEGGRASEGREDGGREATGETSREAGKKDAAGNEKEDGEVAALRAQLEAQQQLLKQYQEAMEKHLGGKEKEEAPAGPKDQVPNYGMLQIPPQLREMLLSENPDQLMQGLGTMMQGVAQLTHMRVRQEMMELMDQRLKETSESTQRELTEKQKAAQTQEQVKKDWETTYPDLAGKDLQPLVAHIGAEVAREMGATEWSEKLRDAIAARVRKAIGRSDEGKGTGAENRAEGPKPKVPYASRGSARQGAPAKVDPVQADIMDTLGLR